MEQPDFTTYSNESMTLLLCPYCRREIPLMTLTIENNDILITIKCSCEYIKTSSNNQMKLTEYMIEMKKEIRIKGKCSYHQRRYIKYCPDYYAYLCQECLSANCLFNSQHICLLDDYININCMIHKSTYVKYCTECNLNLCSHCIQLHTNHWEVFAIDSICKTIQLQSLDTLYYRIKTMLESTNDNFIQLKQKGFNHWLCNAWFTVVTFRYYPSFQILNLLNDIIIFIERIDLNSTKFSNEGCIVSYDNDENEANKIDDKSIVKNRESIEQSTYYSEDDEMDIEH